MRAGNFRLFGIAAGGEPGETACRNRISAMNPSDLYPLSSKLFATAKEYIPGGVNSPVRAFRNVGGEPFFVRRAKGSRIEDIDGKTYIDYIGSWGPNILGHAPAVITNTIHEVAKDGVSFGIPNPFEVEMARTITEWVPSVKKVRMCNSGTEATMSAIRLARGFTKRDLIVKFDGCYHGHSDSLLVAAGSGALTHGEPDSAGVPADFARNTLVLPYNDPEALTNLFAAQGERIAAIIVESYPANAGLVFPRPGYLELLSRITREYGALLIFDEVMTGFRVGAGCAQGLYGITPDLTTLGKVIGGGLPVGAFGGRREIMAQVAPLGPVYQAGTLSGNPVAVAAGLATLKCVRAAGFYEQLTQRTRQLTDGLRAAAARNGVPFSAQAVGGMFGLYFRPECPQSYAEVMSCDQQAFNRFFHGMLDAGHYFAPAAFEAGFVSAAHAEADIAATVAAAEAVFKAW